MGYTPWTGTINFPGSHTLETPPSPAREPLACHIIPLDCSPNQTLQVSLNIDGRNRQLQLKIRYNEMANYWVATIATYRPGRSYWIPSRS